MTPSPFQEAALVVITGVLFAWAVTYTIHSTMAVAVGVLTVRVWRMAAVDRARVWRWALTAPLLTASLQLAGIGNPFVMLDASAHLPQVLIDWRWGVVSVAAAMFALAVVGCGWIAGAIGVRRAFGLRRPASAFLQHEAAEIARRLGCRTPRVTMSECLPVPAALGVSEVCVPAAGMDAMPPAERCALMAHEVGHLAAHDPAWAAALVHVIRLTPFQPLNRWALRQWRDASEEAADDVAVSVTGDPVALARGLVALVAAADQLPGAAYATGSTVVTRVTRLLSGSPVVDPWRVWPRRIVAASAVLLVVCAAPGLTASPDALANRLPWLSPSPDEPNVRMLAVRHALRTWRDTARRRGL